MDVIRPLFVKEERHEKDVRVADDNNKEKLIESTRKEMGEMKEENERLKKVLTKIMKDYDSLQRQVFSITQKEEADKKSTASIHNQTTTYRDAGEEAEFVSLSLGMSSSSTKAVKRKDQFNHDKNATTDCKANQGLTLGLSSSNRSAQASECSSKGSGRDVQDIAVTNHTVLDVTKYDANDNDEDALQHHVQVKRARVSVRTRCDTPTMNDGCQWRKYGQKISKGNPCPRAYYRCTMAPACPVRKQVQRCAEDMSILTTTYEGTHNHPLPVAATTMASTTSAAATMLLSGVSSTSQPFSMATAQSTTAGLSFSSQYQGIPTNPYVTMNPSTFSTSLSHPTVTLDLTDPSSFSSVMLNQSIVPSNILSSTPLKYHPISGNTSATESTSDMQSSWRNHISRSSGYPSYFGKNQQSFETKNPYVSSSHDYQSQVTTSLQQSLLALKDKFPTKNENVAPSLSTDLLAKVLSSDLGFQAAFAATISSITKSKMDVQGSKATFPSNSIHSSPLALSASSNSSSFLTPAKSGGAIFK